MDLIAEIKDKGRAAILALALSLPVWSDTDDALRLPDRAVTGQSGGTHSSYSEMRERSRKVLNFRPKIKTRRPNIAAEFVGESVIPGAQIWAYPDGGGYPAPAITDFQAQDGKYSLEVSLKADAYAGGAICSPSPLDFSAYLETGALEFWIKGDQGKEVFSIGLLDNGNNPMGRPLQVSVSSRSYSKVLNNEWRRIRVPLKAFGGRGSYWSEEVNARIFSTLNWSAISCFSFDIDKERFKTFKVWMDNVVVYKKAPKDNTPAGEEYSISNEDFEDFPGGASQARNGQQGGAANKEAVK
ncbi:MAG: cellulose-binding domain protein [Fibrobacteres bacterium]|nr:cellulose-binding domain protein [Fibrobacterota bacterium]